MGLHNDLLAVDKNNSYREDIKNVYFKIEGVFIDTNKNRVRIPVRGYLSEYARHNQGLGIFKRVFYAPIDYFKNVKCTTDDLTKRAYKFIKTMPEFENSKNATAKYKGKIDITTKVVEQHDEELKSIIKKFQN